MVAKTKATGSAKRKMAPKSREMPKSTKPQAALTDIFKRALAELPDVEPRQMFGYPAAFTKSQMFASLFQDHMIVRLSDVDRQELRDKGGQPFEPMPGRPMREYVTVLDAICESFRFASVAHQSPDVRGFAAAKEKAVGMFIGPDPWRRIWPGNS
jgi:TfoX/Sxy family transcriptional regulator of competence genes